MAAPMYNVFTGTETGLLKGINLVKDFWKNINEIKTPNKSNEIRSLSWSDESEAEICIGLRDKRVGYFDTTTQIFTDFVTHDSGSGDLRDVFKYEDLTVTALDSGIVALWRDGDVQEKIETCVKKDTKLSCMVQNKYDKMVIGTGGKESDLKLWDLNDCKTPTFEAKNVRHDWLELRVPVWVTGIEFLDEKKIVTSTGYHQVRVYDPNAQRRPVMDMSWDEYPITSMSLYTDTQVIAGNTHGNMALIDIRKGKMVHLFKGFAGSIRSVKCHSSQPVVASCGLDRFFRVHDINSRELLHKKYLKSRLNCLLLSKEDWISGEQHNDEDVKVKVEQLTEDKAEGEIDEGDDDVWTQMKVVKTKTIKRKDMGSFEEDLAKKPKKSQSKVGKPKKKKATRT